MDDTLFGDSAQKLQVVVDCDAGADDALAILLLLTGEAAHKIDIVAITCVAGNTSAQNVCTNVLRVLHATERLDIPIYCGAHGPLIPHNELYPRNFDPYHGKDGFGDLGDTELPDLSLIKNESAVAFLNQITASKKGEIFIVCLGPLTNIALTIQTYKDFSTNLKGLYIMGGNYKGIGNTTAAAEFNFYLDPEAAYIVLNKITCLPILMPWEVALNAELPLEWRFGVLGNVNTAAMKLLNRVEKRIYEKNTNTMWNAGDAILAAILLCPAIIKESCLVHLSVELQGNQTRGQGVIDHLASKAPNIMLIKDVDLILLKKILMWGVCVKQT